jgi:predicted TIM-barrel fold metal-dependent hydrolase
VLALALVLSATPSAQDLRIREYKPKSTLVVAQHPVPRAKYPVIDVHSHHWDLTADRWATVVREMDSLNLRILVNLSGGTGARLRQNLSVVASSAAPTRMVQFANMDYSDINDPLFGHRVALRLEEDAKAGARGLKIFKDFGLSLKRASGQRVPVDDPAFDEVFETCARLGLPVLIHTGEPAPFFDPVDEHNERWLELQVHPERRRPASDYPAFETLMAERDRLFARHPRTMFIAAHFGFHANNLDRLGRLLDRLPNVYTETGAIIEELARQPRAAHAFFDKYQDRILFGKDTYAASEYPAFFRTFETSDEYFDGYRDYHAFWKLYGLDLPDMVVRKLYYGNALKLIHGLPIADFPPLHGSP